MSAPPDTEVMRWEEVGEAARVLAEAVHADGYRPGIILAIARGGLIPAAAVACALGVKNTFTMNVEFYVWRRTDRWITFPWSAEPPVG